MKPCCVITLTDDYVKQRPFYANNSVKSFKKWHPEIEVIILNDELLKPYDTDSHFYSFGLARFSFIKDLFSKGYTKVIHLGADTLTLSRFDEFLDDNTTPMIATLDFNGKFFHDMYPPDIHPFYKPHHGIIDWPLINSDVCCFNNPGIISDIENECRSNNRHEQAGMNYVYPRGIKIVDYPYNYSPFVYNNRSKGWLGTGCVIDGKFHFGFDGPKIGEFNPIFFWKPVGDRLFNHLGKHVKAFHFCIQDSSEDPKTWFNEETVKFFVEQCECDWSLKFLDECK